MEFPTSAVAFVAFFDAAPLLLLRSLTQAKAVISIPFFERSIVISVHRKVVLSMDFLFYSELLSRPFQAREKI